MDTSSDLCQMALVAGVLAVTKRPAGLATAMQYFLERDAVKMGFAMKLVMNACC